MPYPNLTMDEVDRAHAFEAGLRPLADKLIGQYQKGLITGAELAEEILGEYVKADI